MAKHQSLKNLPYILSVVVVVCVLAACGSGSGNREVDALNDISYRYHYRSLDSVWSYARRASRLAGDYPDGAAEAANNLAFVHIARMRYSQAWVLLDSVLHATDNQLELLVANVQMMRLCQRRSDSKNFYHYRQKAMSCMSRLDEDESILSARQVRRLLYARTEYAIVASAYFYYIGQMAKSSEELSSIDPNGPIVKDTAQMLAYYYSVGSGGVLQNGSHEELMQSEFDYLMRCYLLSRQYRYAFWEANSMQAISEHIRQRTDFRQLHSANIQEFDYLNVDQMPDSLLCGNLAQRALTLFMSYGDVYQVSGAWRTLSEAYSAIGDYESALTCLDNALSDSTVNEAPDLVASIREQLSMVYSAMDDKPQSDFNRNIYLDLQERTRQDRQLEARAEQLGDSLRQLDMMIVAVVVLIAIVVAMLVYFGYWRLRHSSTFSIDSLRQPLERWRMERGECYERMERTLEEAEESVAIGSHTLERYRKRNVEQRAKVWLASSVVPLISRMHHEIKCLSRGGDSSDVRAGRLEYVSQLADLIGVCNAKLTHWIQLRQGDFKLHIESFPLCQLFDVIVKNAVSFRVRGITLRVENTEAVVKADRILTLFMVNTIAENARNHTAKGGTVTVWSETHDRYVEISVADDGCGMTKSQVDSLFSHKVIVDSTDTEDAVGHGFGLVNCRGIIDKYRKLSSLFSVCDIGAESKPGKGSRFYFRLPKGTARFLAAVVTVAAGWLPCGGAVPRWNTAEFRANWTKAAAFADSAYYSNIGGTYSRTMSFADSCLRYVNRAMARPKGGKLRLHGDIPLKSPELYWLRDSVKIDYNVLLDIRNEAAVAALALHRWDDYAYNNGVYTQLYRECSADNTLPVYVREMQIAESNRNVAIVVLVLLFASIFPVYYLVYYRHRMFFCRYIDTVGRINEVLLRSDIGSEAKLKYVERINMESEPLRSQVERSGFNGETPEAIRTLVADICDSLREDIKRVRRLSEATDAAVDDGRRIALETDRLYVANNVLDNCLSSLKHETMYYPSRLKQIVDSGDGHENVETLDEMTGYYETLYTALITQSYCVLKRAGAMPTVKFMMAFLKSVLKSKNGGVEVRPVVSYDGNGYFLADFAIDNHKLLSEVGDNPSVLFSASTPDVDFLVCCQIMRDIGECTGARGCGITVRTDTERHLLVCVKAPEKIEKYI